MSKPAQPTPALIVSGRHLMAEGELVGYVIAQILAASAVAVTVADVAAVSAALAAVSAALAAAESGSDVAVPGHEVITEEFGRVPGSVAILQSQFGLCQHFENSVAVVVKLVDPYSYSPVGEAVPVAEAGQHFDFAGSEFQLVSAARFAPKARRRKLVG